MTGPSGAVEVALQSGAPYSQWLSECQFPTEAPDDPRESCAGAMLWNADSWTPAPTIRQNYNLGRVGGANGRIHIYLTFMMFWRIREEVLCSGLPDNAYRGELRSIESHYHRELVRLLNWMIDGFQDLTTLEITWIPYLAQTVSGDDPDLQSFSSNNFGVNTTHEDGPVMACNTPTGLFQYSHPDTLPRRQPAVHGKP